MCLLNGLPAEPDALEAPVQSATGLRSATTRLSPPASSQSGWAAGRGYAFA